MHAYIDGGEALRPWLTNFLQEANGEVLRYVQGIWKKLYPKVKVSLFNQKKICHDIMQEPHKTEEAASQRTASIFSLFEPSKQS